MYKFDLERAKIGHELITRDGKEAKLIGFNAHSYASHKLIVKVEGITLNFCDHGEYHIYCESINNLFMKYKIEDEPMNKDKIPFDLERAKLGHELITRDLELAKLIKFDDSMGDGYKILASIGINKFNFHNSGHYEEGKEDRIDLFMKYELEDEPCKKELIYFDLDRAKLGHELVTRDGSSAKFIRCFYHIQSDSLELIASIGNITHVFMENGKYIKDENPHLDLFMKHPENHYHKIEPDNFFPACGINVVGSISTGSTSHIKYDHDENKGEIKETGAKFDDDKPSFSCLPPAGLYELGKIEALGKKKYGPNNYRTGLNVSRFSDAIFRHLIEFMNGNDCDNIDGNNHLASIAWNALAAIQVIKDHPELDDRYKESNK